MHTYIDLCNSRDWEFQYFCGTKFHIYPLLSPSCQIDAWEDYCGGYGYQIYPFIPKQFGRPVYLQSAMGVLPLEKGMRFIDNIIAAKKLDRETLLKSLKNKNAKKKV